MGEFTTKEKILRAARELFAVGGYSGTSIGSIAKQAGVNHSLIFHHFENKDHLWASVKESIVADTNRHTPTLPSTDLPFADFLRKLFINKCQFYRDNPDIIRMLNWQRLEHGGSQRIGVTPSKEMDLWIAAFTHYQQTGDINRKYKPEYLISMMLAVISSMALDPNAFITDQESYIDFCLELFCSALR